MNREVVDSPRVFDVSVREARMCIDRILLVCRLPSGYVHGVREVVLLSQSMGLGGFRALYEGYERLREGALERVSVQDADDGVLVVDGGGIHAWVLLPTLMDLGVERARSAGRATLRVSGVQDLHELHVMAALGRRYGTGAEVSQPDKGAGHEQKAVVTLFNTARPLGMDEWDPLLAQAIRHGYPVDGGLWRAIHALSNQALAPDSVVSRRHAGPVILRDDGTLQGRPPADDDMDLNMLRHVPSSQGCA
ncbi:hypothetical protein [Pigmentiphaga kullae]|uniref:Uncharacterized protein n=1 Tax=Pigmentiphaga kullae TaxID=151784 RepID=A0A4V2F365_9BURK|nr:hypothetical protein [Pigmentiphaga kullae]RZS81314.1 hypothetical protein EV675_3937 [Pigmentiphaga kullae]